jgi:hypothetical protein
MALSVYDVVKGISQAVHNKHHGAVDDQGKLIEIGLKREDQPIIDQRVMDGFGVSMQGNLLILKYNSIEPIANLKEKRFEKEVERRIEEIKKFIQKEFEKATGTNLKLKEVDEIKVLVETSNRVKAMVKAVMAYEVGNLKDKVGIVGCHSCMTKIEEMDAYYKNLEKGKVKPKNDLRKSKK